MLCDWCDEPIPAGEYIYSADFCCKFCNRECAKEFFVDTLTVRVKEEEEEEEEEEDEKEGA